MKILVGYDGTGEVSGAIALALKHAKAFGAEIDVLTSLDEGTENDIRDISEAEKGLEKIKQYFDKEKIPCKTHLMIRGVLPGEDLVTFARENRTDEIIIGVKRRSKVGKLIFGSTAQYVILEATCPVVTVK
ncbi:MAG: universal stress protein [Desulfobacteraceae bacterium]|nr:MAG: universal stress protein [Desulfobacteraceae bacterium]